MYFQIYFKEGFRVVCLVTNEEKMRRAGVERLGPTIHCYNKVKENGWPHPQTAERKSRPYSNVLGARRRQKKERESEVGMAKHLQRRSGRDGC